MIDHRSATDLNSYTFQQESTKKLEKNYELV